MQNLVENGGNSLSSAGQAVLIPASLGGVSDAGTSGTILSITSGTGAVKELSISPLN